MQAADPRESHTQEVTAALLFRVGAADEPLVQRGVTHLVEHLALAGLEDSPGIRFNGYVGSTRTTFVVQGTPAGAVAFLAAVADALHDLPADRVVAERRVLQTEAQRRTWGTGDRVLAMRYGTAGIGRVALPEWGLEWLGHGDAAAWARDWFTADNAVLWTTAELPGLDLTLPRGSRRTVDIGSEVARFPAGLVQGGEEAWLSAVVDRSTTTSAAVQVLERRLQRRLRREEGVSYAVQAVYEPLSADKAHVAVVADLHSQHAEQAVDVFLDTVRRLVDEGADQDELDDHRRRMREQFDHPGAVPGWLDHVAQELLFGVPDAHDATFLDELDALQPADIGDGARTIRDRALLMLPVEVSTGLPDPFVPWAAPQVEPVRGASVRWRYSPPGDSMRAHVAPEGVTMVDERGEALTVRFDACTGVVAWADGSRLLYGRDGSRLLLHADEWKHHDRLRDHVDQHAPRPFVELDEGAARDPDFPRAARRWWWRRLGQRMVGSVTGWIVATLVIALAAYLAFGPRSVPLFVVLVGVVALEFRKQRRADGDGQGDPNQAASVSRS